MFKLASVNGNVSWGEGKTRFGSCLVFFSCFLITVKGNDNSFFDFSMDSLLE